MDLAAGRTALEVDHQFNMCPSGKLFRINNFLQPRHSQCTCPYPLCANSGHSKLYLITSKARVSSVGPADAYKDKNNVIAATLTRLTNKADASGRITKAFGDGP